jgi:uncharacterized protein (DUF885 family)
MAKTGMWRFMLLLCAAPIVATAQTNSAEQALRQAADTYLEHHLRMRPLDAYEADLPLPRHDRFTVNELSRLREFHTLQDAALLAVASINPDRLEDRAARIFRARFMEWLAGQRGVRVCRRELWNVDHIFGPQAWLQMLVEFQPVADPQSRQEALQRWSRAAAYFDNEIANLRRGLAAGYSAPASVVGRLLGQLHALDRYSPREHPWFELARNSGDTAFMDAFATLLETQLQPALHRYATFLEEDYLPAARTSLAITANPNGRACYMAQYRSYTTLSRTPEEVHEIGMAAVEANMRDASRIAREIYGSEGFADALAAAQADPAGEITSEAGYQGLLEQLVERSRELSAPVFERMPARPLVVTPLPAFQQGTGVSPHYVPGSGDRPGRFVFDPSTYREIAFSGAEVLAIHEGYPGHHLQSALTAEREAFHPAERLFSNAAYTEGWARYAEALAEELGIYRGTATPVLRRAWPARGMVLDTALHVLGWDRERLVAFLQASGRRMFAENPDELLDRMAIWPAQLTAYDSGALELFALREQMREAQRDSFRVETFHRLVLEDGVVPLELLRSKVEAVVAASAPAKAD